jgi:predicted O-methyltransferase YrrM
VGFGIKTKVVSFIVDKKRSFDVTSRHLSQLYSPNKGKKDCYRKILESYERCDWSPHPQYSVFTQHDKEFYLDREQSFRQKYRYFYAVSKAISPTKMIEIGAFAGSSADAYISATPTVEYTGIDLFGLFYCQESGKEFDPYETAKVLFTERGFSKVTLLKQDLRRLDRLPHEADFVVVDAAHDFENEYADLKLALTANPKFIFVDDADDPTQALPAIEKFLVEDLAGKVAYTVSLDYIGGGLVIKLKD